MCVVGHEKREIGENGWEGQEKGTLGREEREDREK